MRSCLFFILALVFVILNFGKAPGGVAYAQSSSSQIRITAYVPEHISFKITSGKIDVSTNREEGLWVLGGGQSISGDMVEIKLDNDRGLSSFIVVPKI